MKALQLTQYKQLEIVEMATPEPAADEILVRVGACGICGSDVHGYDGSSGRRIPPIVMGHEAAGVVAAAGRDVKEFREGDRVTFDSTIYCGKCFYCRRGQVNLCDNRKIFGVSTPEFRRMGAFAEYVVAPQSIVYKLPDELSFADAALIEAVSVAVHATGLTHVALGDTAVVVGAGMIGLLVTQCLRLAGAGQIVVIDIDETRLATASTMGAMHVFNSAKADVPAEVRGLTHGRGADVALECVGTTPTIKMALDATRKGGGVTLVGNVTPTIELGLQSVVTREIRLQGSCASSGEYPQCIDLLARGAIQVRPLVTAVAPLSEGAAWFKRLHSREPNLLKVILEP
ncbi:MAG: galactitol-1-phosphate 5-dehydrogenase [Candidatus Acidiferrum sp.]